MNSITTIEGLIFRSYLSFYNLSLIHKCIKAGDDDYKNDVFKRAALSESAFDFEQKIERAKKHTDEHLDYCRKNKIRILSYKDKDYPGELLKLKDFPPVLFVKGKLPAGRCAAIVGTRQPSALAKDKVDLVANVFAEEGFGIVSGLALGIDSMAHTGALNNNVYTAGITPHALDLIRHTRNKDLANRIIDAGGAIISEQVNVNVPVAIPLVIRNRIIAALSDYLIPIEMGVNSGTRHSVRFAVKYEKKLILCKPNYQELNDFPFRYEGLIYAIKKYRGKANVSVISDLSYLQGILRTDGPKASPELF